MWRRADAAGADVDAAFARLSFTTDLQVAAADADFVIEAAVEKLDVKRRLFADLDRVAPPHAILATNSSSIVSSRSPMRPVGRTGSAMCTFSTRPW